MKKIPKASKKTRNLLEKQPLPPQSGIDDISLWHEPFVHVVLILLAGFFVYFNTVATPFLFDDYPYLVNNPAIKDFSYFLNTDRVLDLGIFADIKNNFILRPVSYFSFALNYTLHGLDVRGYHVTNLIIHIGNALLVYLLLSLTLKALAISADGQKQDDCSADTWCLLPLFCALLFVCHPLQTQAVTYIIQRFTSLVTLFYLGSLVLYAYSRLAATNTPRISCYTLSVVAAILAMKTKENAFTLPAIIALYEFIFFSGSFGKRALRLVPFLLTMAILPLNLMSLSSLANTDESDTIVDSINLVNFRGVSPWDYLMTQFGVITTYLRLLILPVRQNFDYDYTLQKNFFSTSVLLPLCLLLIIMGTGIYLLYRSRKGSHPGSHLYKIIAFGIFWFFITLSVESSIIPIDDLIFEHRAYLPSVGFFMSLLAGAAAVYRQRSGNQLFDSRAAIGILIAAISALSAASISRNTIWRDSVTFWSDVAQKSPNKARVHANLGISLIEQSGIEIETKDFNSTMDLRLNAQSGLEAGIKEFRTAIRLNPKRALSHIRLGKALVASKRYDEAESVLLTAAQLDPRSPLPHILLGEGYIGKGDLDEAESEYMTAIDISPSYPYSHIGLGELYAREERYADAIKELETAFRLYPEDFIRNRIVELNSKQGKGLP